MQNTIIIILLFTIVSCCETSPMVSKERIELNKELTFFGLNKIDESCEYISFQIIYSNKNSICLIQKCSSKILLELVLFGNSNFSTLNHFLQGKNQYEYYTVKKFLTKTEWDSIYKEFDTVIPNINELMATTASVRFCTSVGNNLDSIYVDNVPKSLLTFINKVNSIDFTDTSEIKFIPSN